MNELDPIFKSEGVALRARDAIIEANNSLYGSHSFFLSPNGGEPDKYHLARPIEDLKARSNKLWCKSEQQAALLGEMREALQAILAAPMIDHQDSSRSAYGIARAAIAKLDASHLNKNGG